MSELNKLSMNLEQEQKFQNWLDSKKVKPVCPVCGADNWQRDIISSALMKLTENKKVAYYVPEKERDIEAVSMVRLTCKNCAYIMLFATAPIGLP